MDHDFIGYGLFPRYENPGVHGADDGATLVAIESDLIAFLYGNDDAVTIDAGRAVHNDREVERFGRHDYIVTAAALGAIVNALLFNILGNAGLRGQITSAHVFLRCS